MPRPSATIVVVPRQRFSLSARALESLVAHTAPLDLVYVDGGSPPSVRRYLEGQARTLGFRLVRTDHYLAPNEARNVGLAHADGAYVVFIDNDVLVSPDWLEALVSCAEDTRAWLVGPLYCIGPREGGTVHMAGGTAHITEAGGRRVLVEQHRLAGSSRASVAPALRREEVELLEFHCALARRDVFDRLGPLDEALLSSPEHIDLCLAARAAGGTVFFEPRSVVTYVPPPPFAWSDLPYFLLRWSDAWNRASLAHFAAKWSLATDAPFFRSHYAFLTSHRQDALKRWRDRLRRHLGWRYGSGAADVVERALTSRLVAGVRHRRARRPAAPAGASWGRSA
jgi:GT2 family glycosyltransferase